MYTIVVADDEAEIRQALVRRVNWESVGFTVVGEAENGAEALELVESLEPDLLLTDICMPFISGIELARQVREVRPATQIAFLSGYDDFSYAQQAIQYNIISYLLKPISAQELTEELLKIKEKIDEKFRKFEMGEEERTDYRSMSFLMPLILDEFQDEEDGDRDQRLLERAVECGIIQSVHNDLRYTVMVSRIMDADGKNVTMEINSSAINFIAKKYLKPVTFYINGKMITFLMGTQGAFDKYLHIVPEEISQSVSRIMGKESLIGVGRLQERLSDVHQAYVEATKAYCFGKEKKIGTNFISDVERHKNSATLITEQALALIERGYQNPDISLVSVSSEIAVSPNYLSASMKRITGSTFIELLTKKRMNVAKELLLHSNLKVRECAEKCGYNDQHYFSYCFKKYAGLSPNECRRKASEST